MKAALVIGIIVSATLVFFVLKFLWFVICFLFGINKAKK
jgi:hypothetical protein